MPEGALSGVKRTLPEVPNEDPSVNLLKNVLGIESVLVYHSSEAGEEEFPNFVSPIIKIDSKPWGDKNSQRALNRLGGDSNRDLIRRVRLKETQRVELGIDDLRVSSPTGGSI